MFTFVLIFIATRVPSMTLGSIRANNRFVRNEIDVNTVASCAYLASKRLFVPRNGLVVMCNGYDELDDAVVRITMTDDAPLVVDRPVQTVHGRTPKYIAIEHDRFSKSRESLLSEKESLRYFQYLFVTEATREQIYLFARDLWNAGFRDVAFLTINSADSTAIVLPSVTGNEIVMKNVGFCTSSRNNIEKISPFATDQNRFCSEDGCVLKLEHVIDPIRVQWQQEDELTLENSHAAPQSVKPAVIPGGKYVVDRFGIDNNVTIDESQSRNWTDALDRLINGDVDILIAGIPENIETLESLEVVTYYDRRMMVYVDLVQHRKLNNDFRKMLMTFHHTVWLAVVLLLILYAFLLCCLRKFANMGLIGERLDFMYVLAIMLGQGVTFPRKFSLRLVLLIWMVFSLYMILIYSSTVTSLLSQLVVEKRITKPEEFLDTGRFIGGPVTGLDELCKIVDEHLKSLCKRYKVMNATEAIEALYKNEAMIMIQSDTINRLNWIHKTNRSRRIYEVSRSGLLYSIFMFSRKDYRYTRILRDIGSKYLETGQIGQNKLQLQIRDKKVSQLHNFSIDYLTAENVRPLIITFLMGLEIGVLIFIVELLYPYILKFLR